MSFLFFSIFLLRELRTFEVREQPECESLESFLGNFGNQWRTDCNDTDDGSLCHAGCSINDVQVNVYCSCNGDRCYWIPDQIQLQEADWVAETLTINGPRSRYAHLAESYYDQDEWGALWRLRFRYKTNYIHVYRMSH